jgi:hypothetical protein
MSARDFTGSTLSGADLTPLDTPQPAATLEYKHLLWGELIYGAKAEIQSFGIAVGRAFPGEPGGPRRKLSVLDPRGFQVGIDVAYDGIRYCASISFPGRKEPNLPASQFARGVMKHADMSWADEYIGTGEALAAAGLVRMDQLPGQPGMRKTRVVIFADGSIPSGAPTVRHARSEEPGAKAIERASKTTYSVRVRLSEGEQEVRVQAHKRARAEYEARMLALPRPAPLISSDRSIEEEMQRIARQREAQPREEFKGRAARSLQTALDFAREAFVNKTYSLDDESLCDFEKLTDDLMDIVMGAEVVRADEPEVSVMPAEVSAPTRALDPALQSFLRKVMNGESLVKNENPEGV